MLGPGLLIAAILLRVFAGLDYLLATIKGEAQPNPVTWLFWGLSPLVAFIAQIQKTIQPTAWITLALSLGPLLIFATSLTKSKRWKIGMFDILCGASAAIGIILWQVTSDPVMALIFSIVADILGGIPTVRKAYEAPQTEKSLPYFLSMASMGVTLFSVHVWTFLNFGFPLYILFINSLIFGLVVSKVGLRRVKILDNTPIPR